MIKHMIRIECSLCDDFVSDEYEGFFTKDNLFHCINCIKLMVDISKIFDMSTEECVNKFYIDPHLVLARLSIE